MLAMALDPKPGGAAARLRGAVAQRVRTLPDRHGGPVVLGVLGGVLVVGFVIRLLAALNPPPVSEIGNDATAYMRLAASLFELGTYGAPNQLSPSDWSPGAPLLYGGSTTSSAACGPASCWSSSRFWGSAR